MPNYILWYILELNLYWVVDLQIYINQNTYYVLHLSVNICEGKKYIIYIYTYTCIICIYIYYCTYTYANVTVPFNYEYEIITFAPCHGHLVGSGSPWFCCMEEWKDNAGTIAAWYSQKAHMPTPLCLSYLDTIQIQVSRTPYVSLASMIDPYTLVQTQNMVLVQLPSFCTSCHGSSRL